MMIDVHRRRCPARRSATATPLASSPPPPLPLAAGGTCCFLRPCSLISSRANRSSFSALVSPASLRPWNITASTFLCCSIASATHTAFSAVSPPHATPPRRRATPIPCTNNFTQIKTNSDRLSQSHVEYSEQDETRCMRTKIVLAN
uniref:Uncharacterized protein n=1 Tax=Oryza nivara TaxID=4536 RepID=A0A0E0HWF8_ORYNI